MNPDKCDFCKPEVKYLGYIVNNLFIWGEEQEEAFQALKSTLTSAPIIAYPDFNESFTLQTDASDTGLGVVVIQVQNGEKRVIAYASRILNKAERNYSTTEKECSAISAILRAD